MSDSSAGPGVVEEDDSKPGGGGGGSGFPMVPPPVDVSQQTRVTHTNNNNNNHHHPNDSMTISSATVTPSSSPPSLSLPSSFRDANKLWGIEAIWTAIEDHCKDPTGKLVTLKSLVGGQIKKQDPVRFSNRDDLKQFLAFAVQGGFVNESGQGPNKVLSIPSRFDITFAKTPPCPESDVPTSCSHSAFRFLAFVPDSQTNFLEVTGSTHHGKAQSWHVLGFQRKVAAIVAVQNFPWLKDAIFVEWNGGSTTTSTHGQQNDPWSTNMDALAYSYNTNKKDDTATPSKNLYVCGYGPGTTTVEIEKLFSTYCRVISVHAKRNNIYMFVNTTDVSAAVKARDALNGTKVNGGFLSIKYSYRQA
jgi:hypothetical protein